MYLVDSYKLISYFFTILESHVCVPWFIYFLFFWKNQNDIYYQKVFPLAQDAQKKETPQIFTLLQQLVTKSTIQEIKQL